MSGISNPGPRLPEGHQAPLLAADLFMGSFCLYMTAVATVAWSRGEASWRTPAALLGYVAANFLVSRVITSRIARPARGELLRLVVMTIANPVVYLVTDGPLALWWPGFLINALGQGIVLGLITQRAFWGTLLAVYYVGLYAATAWLGLHAPDWYEIGIHAGVIAMVTLLWARIMSLLGVALRNEHERATELVAARDALWSEMEVAQRIQTLLLPRTPAIPGYRVHGVMLPAAEVGGDYYDVIETTTGRRFLAIGDASGHGVTSGLAMMMARSSLLGALEARPTAALPEIYAALNRSLRQNLERMGVRMYMTFALVEHVAEGTFHAVGRHLPLLVYRRQRDTLEELEPGGLWLGMLDELAPASIPELSFTLARGDVLILYTDGIVEHARGTEMFGDERLHAAIRAHAAGGPERVTAGVIADVQRFSSARTDDMTMLVIEHTESAVAERRW